jgi:bacterioferritin-associated ferredoxin
MYVCLCHGVTENAIREAVGDGVRTLRELSFMTGCGTRCGSCADLARALLQEHLSASETALPDHRLQAASAA